MEKYKDKEWLMEQYWNLNKSLTDIANELGCCFQTIDNWMNKFNIPKRSISNARKIIESRKDNKYRNKDWLYSQYIIFEKSISDIANDLDCGKETIRYWLIKHSINIRSRKESVVINFSQGKNLFKKGHKWRFKKGVNHIKWKGDDAGYGSMHYYISTVKEKPLCCPICNKKKKLELSFDHSLGRHTRNVDDYIWLCHKCHIQRDNGTFYQRNNTNITKGGIHWYIRNNKEKGEYCVICNKKKKLVLASIDHKYTRNVNDYLWLCRSCHKIFDMCRSFRLEQVIK